MGTDEQVCPACGKPVATVVRRHKVLGAWVPKWEPGPCHNPECEASAEPPREEAAETDDAGKTDADVGKTATNKS
ncbi:MULTISPECIES: hypothetical protein [Streptomyces]|uniref:Uncharacterized protein n=1 Tax=Streptomyces dengpaensis TaxID=2049881 RepID=A0ABN5HZP5_9ACTN|nr:MULTISPECIES: hypothetical protein [Streptomyces]AVH56577.1 hypothetical protein C4B68_13240 [Streptomyces dengpaensis]PIB10396.1 hypothetical protein B1C81_07880 [Streptomyces sp. HG99]